MVLFKRFLSFKIAFLITEKQPLKEKNDNEKGVVGKEKETFYECIYIEKDIKIESANKCALNKNNIKRLSQYLYFTTTDMTTNQKIVCPKFQTKV